MLKWFLRAVRPSALCVLFFIAPLSMGAAVNIEETEEYWLRREAETMRQIAEEQPINGRAKNIILFVGDGMGIATVTAARIMAGQDLKLKGGGEEHQLAMEKFPWSAYSKTYSVNQQTSDSAPTATAILRGVKTKDGIIGLGPSIIPDDYKSVTDKNRVPSIAHIAKRLGKGVGIVTTTTLTHATPGSAYAFAPSRAWECDANVFSESRAAFRAGYPDIARQLIEFSYTTGLPQIDVALGGGWNKFLPKRANKDEPTGERLDNRDLTKEWVLRNANAKYVNNRTNLLAVKAAEVDHLLGIFNKDQMEYSVDRDTNKEPSLVEMAAKAMEILKKNQNGYFLLVEGGRIDHGHHAGNAYRALTETIEFDNAIDYAVKNTDPRDTLIIVTADHSHTLTISGYAQRGNPILGLVKQPGAAGKLSNKISEDKLRRPYTSLQYANGPGYPGRSTMKKKFDGHEHEVTVPEGSKFFPHTPAKMYGVSEGRPRLTQETVTDEDYLQEASVALESETHGGEDVPIFARGPQAHLFRGVREQNYIFHVMKYAFGASE
ncbi:MAG TPA: alkaline phosphatase [Verrucomicrobiae bacterium]